MKIRYQIWNVRHNVNKPVPPSVPYMKYENGNWAYPFVAVVSVLPRWSREDLVSLDRAKLEENCAYLNELKDDNEHYEIREFPREDESLIGL